MKICIDYERCMGHAVCEAVAPQVFRLGDDAYTHLLMEQPGEDMRALIEDAADQCPTGALSIED
jgi:ferredoxin